MNLRDLHAQFPVEDIEWRLGRAGTTQSGDFWGMALAYVTNRAIQERLDDVVGPENWRNEFKEGPGGGVLCGISIRIGDEWVTKWDGAENTDMEAVKGGLSGAMKRAGVQWGIGRYLYNLEEGWAKCYRDVKEGRFRGATKEKVAFSWDPPALPTWALPGGSGKPGAATVNKQTGEVRDTPRPAQAPNGRPAPPPASGGFSLNDLVPVGKHKGKRWSDLVELQPDYVEWAIANLSRLGADGRAVLQAALRGESVEAFPPMVRPGTPLSQHGDDLPY